MRPNPLPAGIAALLALVLIASVAPATAAARTPTTSAITPGTVNRTSLHLRATYDVRLTLRYDAGNMTAASTMVVTNTSGASIDRLELNSVPAKLGRLRIRAASVDGRAVTPTVSDQTITLPLGGVLAAGASAKVHIYFDATFRTTVGGSDWLFSKRNGILDVHRWIPWISKKIPFGRDNHGDPFVTPSSPSVRVSITTDRTMVLATSGRRVSASGLNQVFVAENVRDFNVTASPYYRTLTSTQGDTTVRVYYRTGMDATTMMTWAKRSIAEYERLVGEYPYPIYNVAQSSGGFGMESPALTWIPTGYASSRLPRLVAHETAHQWFYAVVGNDQANQPYADEAVVDFLSRYITDSFRASTCSTGRLDLSIYEYSTSCYYEILYVQGGRFLDSLKTRMGSTQFWAALRDYYADHKFRFGSTPVLLSYFDRYTSDDLRPTYRPRFPRYY